MHRKLLLLSAVLFALVNCSVGTKCFAKGADVSAQFVRAEAYISDSNYTAAEAIYKAIVQDYPGTDEGNPQPHPLVFCF